MSAADDPVETIEEMVARIAAPGIAALLGMPPPPPGPTPEEQLIRCRFRDQVRNTAIACGARGDAVRHIVRDAEAVFMVDEAGDTVPKDGRVNPHDPCVLLDLPTWLADLRDQEPFLFKSPGTITKSIPARSGR